MHDEFDGEIVSDMAGSGYEQEGFRGEGPLDEELEQNGHRDGSQNHFGEVFKGKDLEVEGGCDCNPQRNGQRSLHRVFGAAFFPRRMNSQRILLRFNMKLCVGHLFLLSVNLG